MVSVAVGLLSNAVFDSRPEFGSAVDPTGSRASISPPLSARLLLLDYNHHGLVEPRIRRRIRPDTGREASWSEYRLGGDWPGDNHSNLAHCLFVWTSASVRACECDNCSPGDRLGCAFRP